MPPKFETPSSERLSSRTKFGLAMGFAAVNSGPTVFGILLFPIFNITMGLSPELLSGVLFLQRSWHAMASLGVAQVSDNLRSKWGRRRPFILPAALPLGASFAAIWLFPPGLDPSGLLRYLLIASLLFFSLHACYSIPLTALSMEATGDYHERTRLNTFIQVVVFVVLIGAQWVFPFIQWPIFRSTTEGARWFGLIFGGAMAIGAALPFWLTREPALPAWAPRARAPFWPSLKAALGNRPFACILGARTLFTFSYNAVSVFGLYLNYYAVFRGDIRHAAFMQGWNGTIYQLAAIGSLFGYRRLAIRCGKPRALMLAGIVLAVGSVSKLLVYVPGQPWWQGIVYLANGASAAGFAMTVDAMLPDVADYDERESGIRREAIYASVLSWFELAGYSVGTLISGFLVVWAGFDASRGGAQAAATLRLLQVGYFALPFAGAIGTIWLVSRYPLDEAACYGIRASLEARRAERRAASS